MGGTPLPGTFPFPPNASFDDPFWAKTCAPMQIKKTKLAATRFIKHLFPNN
jgi:hypothetical protein